MVSAAQQELRRDRDKLRKIAPENRTTHQQKELYRLEELVALVTVSGEPIVLKDGQEKDAQPIFVKPPRKAPHQPKFF